MDVSRKRILISIIFSFPLLSSLAKRLQKFSLSHSLARSLAIFPFLSFPLSHLHTHTHTYSRSFSPWKIIRSNVHVSRNTKTKQGGNKEKLELEKLICKHFLRGRTNEKWKRIIIVLIMIWILMIIIIIIIIDKEIRKNEIFDKFSDTIVWKDF